MMTRDYVKALSLEEKIAHMIIVRAAGYQERVDEMLRDGKIGGVGAVLIPEQTRDLDTVVDTMNRWREEATIPLFFFADAEWGLAQNFPFATRFPPLMAIGAAEDAEELSALHARIIAKEARTLGFRMISNPPVDVNIEPKNPIICTRAFSDDTDTVINLSRIYVKAMQEEGVIPNTKHYPGHGATAVDSHMAMPVVERTREELMDVELRPYKEICNDMWGVMTAHIYFPALAAEGEEGVPATLSRTMLYDILRGEFGFENLIVSDSLTMKGIKDNYGIEAAVGAIKAGHDIVLQDYMSDPKITYDLVYNAAKNGEIPMSWIDDSVYRILKFKEQLGCMDNAPIDIEEVKRIVGCDEHIAASKRIAASSITQVEGKSLPLNPKSIGKTLIITTVDPEEENKVAVDLGRTGCCVSKVIGEVSGKYCNADYEFLPEIPSTERVDDLIALADKYDTVIVATIIRTASYKENSGKLSPELARMLSAINASQANLVTLIIGSPYVLADLPQFDGCLVAYNDDAYSIEAIISATFGDFEPTGHLPVNVSDKYFRGYSYGK
ncbi:MAG: hypothetical protein IJN71_03915 [Oscillospiraceae bacterium]|nr:hypothetical protein [Oscillospiraceae bacterium]